MRSGPHFALVRLTSSAICGTDLHMVRGTLPDMEPGTVLGHEGIGVVEEVGVDVRNLVPGDRVVIPSTIACGSCSFCRAGYYAQCDRANPNGPDAGTAFFGGPRASGPFDGLQAEYARVPFANVGPVKLPVHLSDEQAILLSDIFPTSWFGEPVNYDEEDPVGTIKHLAGPGGTQDGSLGRQLGAGRRAFAGARVGRGRPAKAGTLGVVGVYPMAAASFPIGAAMNKNLTVNMGRVKVKISA